MNKRKRPFRTDNDISQAFNDGLASLYSVSDSAEPGDFPRPALTFIVKLPYAERRSGFARNYTARQNMIDVSRVIRVPKRPNITTQCVAVTEDGARYRVDMVQSVPDALPPSLDLTLAATTEQWEVNP